MNQGALGDLRVLDLGRMLAAPYAARMLADFGADVVKVEPASGDPARTTGLVSVDGRGVSPVFICANQNKRSVVIDLDREDGRQMLRRLIAGADVLIEDATPDERRVWGLLPADLAAINPDLVHCSVTPHGSDGDGRAADEGVIQAESGLMSVTGYGDDVPGGGPMAVGVPILEAATAYNAVIGVMGALIARRRGRARGQHVDLAMFDSGLALQTHAVENYLLSGERWLRRGNAGNGGHPAQVFSCSDGEIYISAGTDQQYMKLCRALGHPEMIDDPRFNTLLGRDRNRAEIDAILGPIIKAWDRAPLLEFLVKADVPCAIVNSYDDVFADAQVQYRGLKVAPTAGAGEYAYPFVANPVGFSKTPAAYRRPPPKLGEHSEEILAELKSAAEPK